jgi:tRNA(fMet)-specific endonuclease VapC
MVYNSERIASNSANLKKAIRNYKRWPFRIRAAEEFGKIKAELRRLGRPIQDIDVQIAAIARVNDLVLLSDDQGFAHIQGLKLENWLR